MQVLDTDECNLLFIKCGFMVSDFSSILRFDYTDANEMA